ncbi:hypothetical protein Bca101_051533 [Brassica carinata]
MTRKYFQREVLPVTALVTMECANVALNTLFKAATLQGMGFHVFIVYSYGLAALLLLPSLFFSYRCCSNIMGYTGINYSSPTLASAISNLTPAFTFLLAILFRMESVSFKRTSSVAKMLGTIVSIGGAFIVTLYNGPVVINMSPPSISLRSQSPNHDWIIGAAFLAVEYFMVPLWYIVQGLFGSCINNTIHTWALRIKGPLFVAMFKPLSIAIAVAMGVIFLRDSLYIGSLIGATVITIGFYTVMWGKAKEMALVEDNNKANNEDANEADLDSPSGSRKAPLLESYKNDEHPDVSCQVSPDSPASPLRPDVSVLPDSPASPLCRISLSVPVLSDVSVSPDFILSTLSSPIHFDLGLLAGSPSLNPSLVGSLSSRPPSSAVILAGLPPSLSRTGSMSGNDYSRYLSAGSKKSSGSTKSSSRHTNPGSSSNSQMAESLVVPNSQTQASPPAPTPAPAAPAPAPAAPAPAPAAPAPDPAADLMSINLILASPGHDRLPHLHPDRPSNTLCSTEDPSLKKIIYEQAQKIESQGNEISKLYKIVRHLACKDPTVADILQSEASSGSGDDDESDAI